MVNAIILIELLIKLKKICEDKERAAGPDGEVGDPINLTQIVENYRNFRDGNNTHLVGV